MKMRNRSIPWWKLQAALVAVLMLTPAGATEVSPGTLITAPTEAAHARIAELRREIARHDDLYFRLGAPEISDEAYDALKAELRRLETAYPNFNDAGTAVAAVGDDRTGRFPAHRHRAPMPGLAKAFSQEELAAFHAGVAKQLGREDVIYRVEPKFDGLAVSLTYENGRLTRAVTRGNGVEGDDITANARVLLPTLPKTLRGSGADGAPPWPRVIELRGEIFMTPAELARINAERTEAGEAVFANPRNLAAGTIRTLDPQTVAGRRLELACFGWGAWEGETGPADSLTDFQTTLGAWGVPGTSGARVATGLKELTAAVEAVRRAAGADGLPVDGVVVKLERVADQAALGIGPEGPRWAVARKFPAERVSTRLTGITLQVGRSGAVTPVAELAPVKLAGSVVSRASLHNANEIAALGLRIGDTVWVEKAGEIIPVVRGVDHTRRAADAMPYVFPAHCPVCGTELEHDVERAARRCPDYGCPARVARRVEHFASSAGLNIKGLGPATVALLVEHGLVRGPADLYALKREDVERLKGMGKRSTDRLLASIAASRAAEWPAVLRALGLPGVGASRAQALGRAAGDWEALLAVDREVLMRPEAEGGAGFGEAAAREVLAHLTEPAARAELEALATAGVGGAGGGAGGE